VIHCGILGRVNPWATFEAAAQLFAELVTRIAEGDWNRTGLGVWDLRALVGHTSRALITTATYLDRPADVEDVATPEDYYMRMLDGDPADDDAVAARGEAAGQALGTDPAVAVQALVDDVLARLADREDRLVTTPAGGMHMVAYLPTRTFELAVHSLDIGAATGLEVTLPADVLAETASLAARIGIARGRAQEVLAGLTGRRPLPSGFTVV